MLKFTISLLNLFISVQICILSGKEFHSFADRYLKDFNQWVVVLVKTGRECLLLLFLLWQY